MPSRASKAEGRNVSASTHLVYRWFKTSYFEYGICGFYMKKVQTGIQRMLVFFIFKQKPEFLYNEIPVCFIADAVRQKFVLWTSLIRPSKSQAEVPV